MRRQSHLCKKKTTISQIFHRRMIVRRGFGIGTSSQQLNIASCCKAKLTIDDENRLQKRPWKIEPCDLQVILVLTFLSGPTVLCLPKRSNRVARQTTPLFLAKTSNAISEGHTFPNFTPSQLAVVTRELTITFCNTPSDNYCRILAHICCRLNIAR